MTDRPIMFFGPMVLALLAGRKTQTRRLATSPLRRVAVGDRLYVREAWRAGVAKDGRPPRAMTPGGRIWYEADRDNCDKHGRLRPGMHMPRWASRLTLIVEGVKVEALQAISVDDALAEGVAAVGGRYQDECSGRWHSCTVAEYRGLWNSLHAKPGETWADNPLVVALTFHVERGNIDRSPA